MYKDFLQPKKFEPLMKENHQHQNDEWKMRIKTTIYILSECV